MKISQGLRSREAIIASGAYEPPEYRPIKGFQHIFSFKMSTDIRNRDQEKHRLASIFEFGEYMNSNKDQAKVECLVPKLSRFDERRLIIGSFSNHFSI